MYELFLNLDVEIIILSVVIFGVKKELRLNGVITVGFLFYGIRVFVRRDIREFFRIYF